MRGGAGRVLLLSAAAAAAAAAASWSFLEAAQPAPTPAPTPQPTPSPTRRKHRRKERRTLAPTPVPSTPPPSGPVPRWSAAAWVTEHSSQRGARRARHEDAKAELRCRDFFFRPPADGLTTFRRWGGCSALLTMPCVGVVAEQSAGGPDALPPLFAVGAQEQQSSLCACTVPPQRPRAVPIPVLAGTAATPSTLTFTTGNRSRSAAIVDGALWIGHIHHIHLGHMVVDLLLPILAALDAAQDGEGARHVLADDMKVAERRPVWEFLAAAVLPTEWWSDVRPATQPRCYRAGVWGLPAMRGACPAGQSMVAGSDFRPVRPDSFYFALLRRGIAAAARLSPPPREPLIRIGIVSRRKGYARMLANAGQLAAFRKIPKDVRVDVLAWEDRTLAAQARTAAELDAVVSVHGNALFWAVAMREGSVMVEVMPMARGCGRAACIGGGIDTGINRGDTEQATLRGTHFYASLARRLRITHIGWQSRRAATSPEPTREDTGHLPIEVMGHAVARCGRRRVWHLGEPSALITDNTWMCRNVKVSSKQWKCLVGVIVKKVREGYDGADADLPPLCIDLPGVPVAPLSFPALPDGYFRRP